MINRAGELRDAAIEEGKKDPIYGPVFEIADDFITAYMKAEDIKDPEQRSDALRKAFQIYNEAVAKSAKRLEEYTEGGPDVYEKHEFDPKNRSSN